MDARFAPLPHEWMLVGIIGFVVSAFQIMEWNRTWGVTLAVFCIVLFVSSLVSMSGAGTSEEELRELAIHDSKVLGLRHRR